MSSLEKKLLKWIRSQGPFDFPGGKVLCFSKGKKIIDIGYGKTWPIYDLASLTKIVFTTSIYMELFENKKIRLGDKVTNYFPWFLGKTKTISNLLNHTAGNTAWAPHYKKVDLKTSQNLRLPQILNEVRRMKPTSGRKATYSDLDFFMLGGILEKILEKPLLGIWENFKENVLPKTQLHFSPKSQSNFKKSKYAPTEPCVWRKRPLCGEVHDENAYALGEVAPHAGLFGCIDDLGIYALKLREIYKGQKKGFVSEVTLKKFTKASMPSATGFWGLGFMKPSPQGSTAGKYFSSKSFGHTGFTGISLWMDPRRDLIVAQVSNRVFPTRKNKDFQRIRPLIHDWIGEQI